MNVQHLYRTAVVGLLLANAAWFFIPWIEFYEKNSISVLFFLGKGAIFEDSILWVVNCVIFSLYLCGYAGLFFFSRIARMAFIMVLLLGGLWIAANGIAIQSPYEAVLGYFLTLADGWIIGISFVPGINQRFIKK